jgi:hypothetical protein
MAAIFIVAGLAIADKVEKKKEAKRQKKARDEARYRELQIETSKRLARRESASANVIENTRVEDPELEENSSDQDENLQLASSTDNPPPYEDAVAVGERREREWQAQMQRRRSSVASQQSSGTGTQQSNAEGRTTRRYSHWAAMSG